MGREKDVQTQIDPEALKAALGVMLGKTVSGADWQARELHGGTLGDVRLLSGTAEAAGGRLPYRLVLKRQKKWERPGDPGSWRREYALAVSGLGGTFTGRLRWPACYLARMRDDEIELWMEYIGGASGDALTVEMLEQAALEWGRWQGRLHREPELLRDIGCLGDAGFPEREFDQWHMQRYPYDFLVSEPCRIPARLKQMLRDGEITLAEGKSFEYGCLRSRGCGIPGHLKQMLIDADSRSGEIFRALAGLPAVLCHRDLWLENLFFSNGEIILIDWDTAGWGFPGEDIASLIADDTDPACLPEYFRRLVPAYLEGLSGSMDLPRSFELRVWEMMVIKFGYRFVQRYMFADSPAGEALQVEALQQLYEIRGTLLGCRQGAGTGRESARGQHPGSSWAARRGYECR